MRRQLSANQPSQYFVLENSDSIFQVTKLCSLFLYDLHLKKINSSCVTHVQMIISFIITMYLLHNAVHTHFSFNTRSGYQIKIIFMIFCKIMVITENDNESGQGSLFPCPWQLLYPPPTAHKQHRPQLKLTSFFFLIGYCYSKFT